MKLLYRDRWLAAFDKPSGLLVHRSPIDRHETRFALQLARDMLGQRVYPVHRLDKPTSGVLLFALDSATAAALGEDFEQHRVDKHYLAVVRGWPGEAGEVDYPLRDEPDDYAGRTDHGDARPALTRFQRLATVELPVQVERYPASRYALLALAPETGRRHQLRRHCKHIGHPIIGDAKHGKGVHNRFFAEHFGANRLLLHCVEMGVTHPATGERLHLKCPPGGRMARLLEGFDWLTTLPPDWRPAEQESLRPAGPEE